MTNRRGCIASTARTSGPWHTRANLAGVQIVNAAGACVARTPCCDRQAMADGALLAAAPDLLAVAEELEESASYWSEYDVPLGIVDRLRAAIAKAEGRP